MTAQPVPCLGATLLLVSITMNTFTPQFHQGKLPVVPKTSSTVSNVNREIAVNPGKSPLKVIFIFSLLAAFVVQGCAGTKAEVYRGPEYQSVTCFQPNSGVKEYFDLVAAAKPEFVKLLMQFPKGADLHNHLSGAVMPEDYIDIGIEDGDCYGPAADNPAQYAIKKHYMGLPGTCSPGDQPLSKASLPDRQKLVKSLSMYQFAYSDIQSGHDQFFRTFGRFKAISGPDEDKGKMLAKMLQQEDRDSVSYVETMMSFQAAAVNDLAGQLRHKYPAPSAYEDGRNYRDMYAVLQSAGLKKAVAAAKGEITDYINKMNEVLRCGTPSQDRACRVSLNFISQVSRNSDLNGNADPAKIFSQTVFSFALSNSDPRVVGVNLVSGEDLPVSMRNFTTEMQFFRFCHGIFPEVNIALHAGEITPCFVGTKNPALKDHLLGSIDAGAKRIGHGVSFEYLDGSLQSEVAALMKKKNVLVEINLTSNAQILGVAGSGHPFPLYYRKYGVPVSLSTDDEGVSHSNFTTEWLYAIIKYGLNCNDVVKLARSSLQYSFLPGPPLWRDMTKIKVADECAGLAPGGPVPGGSACEGFLKKSAKAKAQWDYEKRLTDFDRSNGESFRQYLGSYSK